MTTFESDQGGQGGPWNLSKKLRFWVFWPLEASGGVLNHIERLLLCSFMSLLMFSFVLVCFVLLVFFVGKKAGPSMALLGIGNS